MKKSYLIITAAALLAAASCQKSDTAPAAPETRYNPVDIVLSAAIEGADTKVGITEDANALKLAWEKDDKISLIATDSRGNILSNDIFTATEAGASAKFSGTYSNPADADDVSVIYPALTEGDGSEEDPWHTSNDFLLGCKKGNDLIHYTNSKNIQKANADPSGLKDVIAMNCMITDLSALTAGKVSATMKNTCYVIKATVKLPTTITTVKRIELATSNNKSLNTFGWTYPYQFMFVYGGKTAMEYSYIYTDLQDFAPASDGTLTAWMVGHGNLKVSIPTGTDLTLTVNYNTTKIARTKTLASDLTLEAGKVYRISVDMTK